MWQKPLLLGDKSRNIVAVQPKKYMRYACITPYKLGKIYNFIILRCLNFIKPISYINTQDIYFFVFFKYTFCILLLIIAIIEKNVCLATFTRLYKRDILELN